LNTIKELIAEAIEGCDRVAVLGAGSPLLGDDAAGSAIAEALCGRLQSSRACAFCGSTAPENFTGEIKKFRPDCLLVIDAADMGLPCGSVALIDYHEIAGVSFSTHMLPLKIMLDYLVRETGCRVALLGIQGGCLEFGAEMSKEVREAVEEVTGAIVEAVGE
jgi:hydrogenase 3 maturation protease